MDRTILEVILFGFTIQIAIAVKLFIICHKFNKLYRFFIRSKNTNTLLAGKPIPPINGECPTKEELDEFDKLED